MKKITFLLLLLSSPSFADVPIDTLEEDIKRAADVRGTDLEFLEIEYIQALQDQHAAREREEQEQKFLFQINEFLSRELPVVFKRGKIHQQGREYELITANSLGRLFLNTAPDYAQESIRSRRYFLNDFGVEDDHEKGMRKFFSNVYDHTNQEIAYFTVYVAL